MHVDLKNWFLMKLFEFLPQNILTKPKIGVHSWFPFPWLDSPVFSCDGLESRVRAFPTSLAAK
jgi:hypothetical protein